MKIHKIFKCNTLSRIDFIYNKKQDKISKEDAEKMLDAIQQKEKELQEKLQKKKVKGKKIKLLKDW